MARDPDAVIPPELLLSVNGLHGNGTALTVDLLRTLLGWSPHLRSHRARNISAVLRSKRKQRGRPPTAADFPALGRVNLFAAAYWGGVDAWAAGGAGRVQRPKGFWRDEANQLQALREFASHHPEQPITTFNLSAGGWPALAIALRGADMESLVEKAGLGARLLARNPNSSETWTAAVVVDHYVALCRQHGVTLSTNALLALGGEASSLQGHARRVFGTFSAMVDVALARFRFRCRRPPASKSVPKGSGTSRPSTRRWARWPAASAGSPRMTS